MIELVLLCAVCSGEPADSTAFHLIHPTGVFQEEPEKTGKEKVEKPPPIPELSAVKKEQVKRYVNSLKNSNPEKRRGYEDKIIAIGRGALPALLEKAGTTHKHQVKGVTRCLVELLDVRDRDILEGFAKSKEARLRLLAAAKYAAAERPKDKDILKTFLKDSDRTVRLEAARGLVRLKDASGVEEIVLEVARCNKEDGSDDRKAKAALLADAGRLKGHVYSSHFRALATRHEDPEVRKAAIQVIVAVGDRAVKDVLGKALSDDHNLVKTAAVNALRQLIKNQEPTTFPTVFALVDAVEKWKKELGLIR